MDNFDPEDFQVCPYDQTHVIRNKRMQPHIHECRKNHPSMEMVKCPFNAAHVIPEAERRWHLSQCPDRHQIHSKIVQEMMEGSGARGCVETPIYRPIVTHGETWEASYESREVLEPFPQRAARRPPRVEVRDEELEGLSGREKRELYFKRKAEQEAAMRNPQMRNHMASQDSRGGSSKSLALLQQQREDTTTRGQPQASNDIYSEALRGPKGINMAIGRGRGTAGGARTPPGQEAATAASAAAAAAPSSRGRGRGQHASKVNSGDSYPPPASRRFQPAGRGIQGGLLPAHSGDAEYCSKIPGGGGINGIGVEGASLYDDTISPARGYATTPELEPSLAAVPSGRGMRMGRGVASGSTATAAAGALAPAGAPYRPYSPADQGAWQVGATPVSSGHVLGRGRGMGSAVCPTVPGSELPLGRMASQPRDLAPSFGRMRLSEGVGRGRGATNFVTPGGIVGNREMKDYTDSEDPEQFMDLAVATGGGYASEESQHSPLSWANNASLDANPSVIDDFEDAEAGGNEENTRNLLRRLEKKLRQISEIEKKRSKGQTLNEDQEEKLKKKKEYEEQVAELRKA